MRTPTTPFAAATTGGALLLLLAAAIDGAAAAEYYQQTPRDGKGPLPITEWYVKPIRGKSTYYGRYQGGGSCGLDQPDGSAIPKEIKGIDWTVALDREQFFQGGCGMCIELHGTGKGSGGDPVKGVYHVFVNNLCPECEYGHLDVAEPGDGLWDITWKAVPCDVGDNNMRFVFMGSNDYYLKVSTQGTRFPTKRLRLKLDGQQWVDGAAVNGAYFEFREHAPYRFPIEVEVTSVANEVLTDWIQSIEGGPSNIQYRREPTDEELDEATPGEEPEADDDIEEGTDPDATPAPTAAPKPPQQRGAPPSAPSYETLSWADEAEAAEYRLGAPAPRRPFMGAEEEEEEEEEEGEMEEAGRWDNQYLRGRRRRLD